MQEEMYFVGSNGDSPDQIYFDSETAFAAKNQYIDSFDSKGNHVSGYNLVNNDSEYTKDF